ncbi:MAG: excinuclease ABC subunit UvrC [Gammaproteobacteria bacterium]|jgi:excinuclease ABC subunit C|nr:excinuclease ABC subunit UvrC [Gammaproteobacteria bacterium]
MSTTPSAFDSEELLRSLPTRPGVYRMLGEDGEVLYVGKASNLRNRVSSYFTGSTSNAKTARLVAQIRDVSITVTRTEGEALLLENNLIKTLRPRYNILLRDDKSYPYIQLSTEDEFPRLSFYRGARREPGRYFGPYPSAGAVRAALNQLQRLFKIRQCDDSFFRSRSRPCLQYQIKRCTAPCVGYIEADTYANDVRHAVMFLEGRNREVIDELGAKMDAAAARLDYEQAAYYRDQIARLRRVMEQQYVSGEGESDIDIIATEIRGGVGCVVVFFVRGGNNLGNKTFFPKHPPDAGVGDILGAFLSQYYIGREPPDEIIVNGEPEDLELLRGALGESGGKRVRITARVRGERARWLQMAVDNAQHALTAQLASQSRMSERFAALQEALGLEALPQRLECFDISHTGGEAAVASCVVFDQNGPLRSDYRRFNIEDITPGDDYAAMRQAVTRRYTRLKRGEARLPDVLFIDGGRGQVAQAEAVLRELQVSGVAVLGVAKGPERRPGMETLFLVGGDPEGFRLPPDSPALQLIQQIRDEAHRFAITGHRGRRAKARTRSTLEDIPGIGPARRRSLLRQFGGLQGVARAGVEDLASVPGISRELAQRIYDTFHGETD